MSKLKSFWTHKVYQVAQSSIELSLRSSEWGPALQAVLPMVSSSASGDEAHPFCPFRMSVRGAVPTKPFIGRVPAAWLTCWQELAAEDLTTSDVLLSALCQLCHQHCSLLWHHKFLSVSWPFHLFVFCFSLLNSLGPFPSLLDCRKRKLYDQTGVVCVLNSWHMHGGKKLSPGARRWGR